MIDHMLTHTNILKAVLLTVLIQGMVLGSSNLMALERYRLCSGESLILSASGDAEAFSWFRNGVPLTEDQATLLVEESGLYTVIAVTEGGCGSDSSDAVEVLVDPIPDLRINQPSAVCEPTGAVDLTDQILGYNTDLYDYIVIDPLGESKQMDELTALKESGTYFVSIAFKGQECWSPPSQVFVYVADEFMEADFEMEVQGIRYANDGGYVDAFLGEDITFIDLSVGDPISWEWDFGDGNGSNLERPVHQYTEDGEYEVVLNVTNDAGCTAVITGLVTVFNDYFLEIPNAFTPKRADGKNNYFKPYYRGIVEVEFSIFNTWGDLIFVTTELESKGWDGTLNGIEVPNGNYVYKGEFLTVTGQKIERVGVFILIK